MAAIGLIVGLIINVNLARRDGINEDFAWNLGLVSIVAGVVGFTTYRMATYQNRVLQPFTADRLKTRP